MVVAVAAASSAKAFIYRPIQAEEDVAGHSFTVCPQTVQIGKMVLAVEVEVAVVDFLKAVVV